MYKKLLEATVITPKLYESTGLAFWDDEHISKMMLENHLSPDSPGATREHQTVADSVDWIASLAVSGKKLLDLGCGPGLYAERLAEKGYEVTGIDISRRSIEYAKESAVSKGYDIEYECGSYLDADLGIDQFDIAIMIYCDFGVLPPSSRRLLLEKTHAALKPQGLFVLDVFSPEQYKAWSDASEFTYESGGFWTAEPHVLLTTNSAYPDRHYLERYVVVTDDELRSYNNWNHAFLDAELVSELKEAGFGEVDLYADVTGRSHGEVSNTLCAVAGA